MEWSGLSSFLNKCCPRSMQPPEVYFGHPQYAASGNLFWPSAWQAQVSDEAYAMHGLDAKAAKVRDRNPEGESGSVTDG